MSDADAGIVVLVIIGGFVGGIIKLAQHINQASEESGRQHAALRAREHARALEIQSVSERRALELIVEFPQLNDFDIATLMRDELMNMRSRDQRYYQWATPETVGRMRRTLVVEVMRAERGTDVKLEG